MASLQFEELGLERVAVPLAVQYVDHNMIQLDFKNPDDHRFLQAFAAQLRHPLLAARQRHLPLRPCRALRASRAAC